MSTKINKKGVWFFNMPINRLVNKLIRKLSLYDLYYYFGQSKGKYADRRTDEKVIYILTEPEYGNLGDQAIALATAFFLKDNFAEYKIVEVSINDSYRYLREILAYSNEDDLFLLQGGGNMGNLYPDIEAARRFCIKHIKNRRIISMPTTVTYTDDKRGRRELTRSKKIYSSNPNLILIAREKYSFDIMQKEYPNNKSFLLPDIVFYLSTRVKAGEEKRQDHVVCLRREIESNLSHEETNTLIVQFCQHYPNAFICDTTVNRNVTAELREYEVFSLLRKFQRAKVVLTDRMHGMIFCSITGTPCVIIKSLDNKVLGSYEWIKDQRFIALHKTVDVIDVMKSCDKIQLEKSGELPIDIVGYSKQLKEIMEGNCL